MSICDLSVMKSVAICALLFAISSPALSAQDADRDSPPVRRTGPPPEGYVEEVVPDEVGEAAVRADEALMKELQQEVEALPEELTHEAGVEILRSRIDEFQTLEARQRVLLSIANIYRQLGNKEEAKRYYEELASLPSFDPHYSSMAKRELASMLSSEGKTDEALKVLADESGNRSGKGTMSPAGDSSYPAQRNPGIDNEFMTLLAEAEVLHRAGRIEESLEILARLERDWSSPMRIELLVPVATISIVGADMRHDYEEVFRLYEQLFEKIPILREREGLLSNRIMTARAAQQMELAMSLTEEYLEKHGDTQTATGHLSMLAGDAADRGDKELAAEYYRKIINHPRASDDYVSNAKENLAMLTTGRIAWQPLNAKSQQTSRRTLIVVILVHVFLVIAGVVFVRYRRRVARR